MKWINLHSIWAYRDMLSTKGGQGWKIRHPVTATRRLFLELYVKCVELAVRNRSVGGEDGHGMPDGESATTRRPSLMAKKSNKGFIAIREQRVGVHGPSVEDASMRSQGLMAQRVHKLAEGVLIHLRGVCKETETYIARAWRDRRDWRDR